MGAKWSSLHRHIQIETLLLPLRRSDGSLASQKRCKALKAS